VAGTARGVSGAGSSIFGTSTVSGTGSKSAPTPISAATAMKT
jgi:hypothetical protein